MPHFGRFEFGNEKPSETYKGDYMVLEKGYVKILRGKPADDLQIDFHTERLIAVIHLDKGESVREIGMK